MAVLLMTDLSLTGKRVLIREDLNVPVADGRVTSDARLRAALPTIRLALERGATVLLMSHLGRPVEGEFDQQFSLQPVADWLADALHMPVPLARDGLDQLPDGKLVLLENVRFNPGEKGDDESLARRYAALCDIFVMDAFGTAHRAQASTHGVARFAPVACAGPLLAAELEALGRALQQPARPLVAIVGGSKVSTKLTVLENLADKVDSLIVGGGIANTFLAAAGHAVGKSLCEPDLIPIARQLMEKCHIPLPVDVVVANRFAADAEATTKPADAVADGEMIFDIGPESGRMVADTVARAGTVLWNGPLGVFEFDQFGEGTRALAAAIADSDAFSVAGGGDTLAAIDKYGIADSVSYISTGGGAFLEFVEGKTLPAVAILEQRGAQPISD